MWRALWDKLNRLKNRLLQFPSSMEMLSAGLVILLEIYLNERPLNVEKMTRA